MVLLRTKTYPDAITHFGLKVGFSPLLGMGFTANVLKWCDASEVQAVC